MDRNMSSNIRNLKAIVILICSMTAAAAVLLLLETPAHGWAEDGSAMDTNGLPVESVTIEVVPLAPTVIPTDYDCAIMPDGRCYWQPDDGVLQLAIIGVLLEPLQTAQARTLLQVLGYLSRNHGLDLDHVELAGRTDSTMGAAAAVLRTDLRELLVKKGIIQ